jgi:hypothetical protein
MNLKNYNLFALRGDSISDMEVCETLGIDPKYAFTPEINEVAINKMQKENYNAFVERGMDPKDAIAKAERLAMDARKAVDVAMKIPD